jgi:hypothetical protein
MLAFIFTICTLAITSSQTDNKVLGDGLHNATYDVDWTSRVEQKGPKAWKIHHTLHNKKPGWIRVSWDGVYDGWIENTDKPKRVGGPTLDTEPMARDSKIAIGDRTFQPTPRHYDLHQTVGSKSVTSEVTVTVKMQDKYETISVRAISMAEPNGVSYDLQLLTDNKMGTSVRFVWKAAESADLNKAIKAKYGEVSKGEYIRLSDKGEAFIRVSAAAEPHLNSGQLVITDLKGQRLGAVHAPAFVPKNKK